MGAAIDVLSSCDGKTKEDDDLRAHRPRGYGAEPDDAPVGCAAFEAAARHAIASANRGATGISEEVLLNHDLLQHARKGDAKGVGACLERGAWTETRRPLVMKPQKTDPSKSRGKGRPGDRFTQADVVGMTALMFASQAGATECVRRLLYSNARVNAVEEDGWTSLHFAAKEAHLEVCKALLHARAECSMLNAEDKTPLQIAKESDEDALFADAFKILLENYVR